MKECTACREEKPAISFQGRNARCRDCHNALRREMRRKTAAQAAEVEEPAGWPVPEMGLFDSLACVRLRNWARDVRPAVNLAWRIAG